MNISDHYKIVTNLGEFPDISKPVPDYAYLHQMAELQTEHWRTLAEFRADALEAANAEIVRLRADVVRLIGLVKPKIVEPPTKGEQIANALRGVDADSYWTGA